MRRLMTRLLAALLVLAGNGSLAAQVLPILEAVELLPDSTVVAWYGYDNQGGNVSLPLIKNSFSPSPPNRGQPFDFLPGRHYRVFSVPFDPAVEDTIVWTLDGIQAWTYSMGSLSPRSFGGVNYQGYLTDGGLAISTPRDLRFTLYDAATGGSGVGAPFTAGSVPLSNGVFSVVLPFGVEFDGGSRWLQVEVSAPGAGTFTALTPRRAITATPYAERARLSDSAVLAVNATAVPWSGIRGVPDNVTNAYSPWEAATPGIAYMGTRVGIGTNTPSTTLDVVGNIKATGTITPSSAALKENVVPIDDALEKLALLSGVRFDWKPEQVARRGGRVHDLGFVAEEVEALFPEVVYRDADGTVVGMDYARMVAVAVQAIKQQRAEIRRLKEEDRNRNAQREREMDALRARLERLEAAAEGRAGPP